MAWGKQEKVECQGYYDNIVVKIGGRGTKKATEYISKEVLKPCPTDSMKSASAARCKKCHYLYTKAMEDAPSDSRLGLLYTEKVAAMQESAEETKRRKDKEIRSRFESGVIDPRLELETRRVPAVKPYPKELDKLLARRNLTSRTRVLSDPTGKKSSNKIFGKNIAYESPKSESRGRNFLKDSEGVPISEIFYGVPPHPGKRAKEERGHQEYDYTGGVFANMNEDIDRKGSDWWFTTWTISPVADMNRAKMSTPTRITSTTKKGSKRIGPVSRTVADMKERDFLQTLRSDEQGREDYVFQCFDCGNHTKGGGGGQVLDMFCNKCSAISKTVRKDAAHLSTRKKNKSIFDSDLEEIAKGHPQARNAKAVSIRKNDQLGMVGFYRHIDRYFVKKRNNQFREIELWDGNFDWF